MIHKKYLSHNYSASGPDLLGFETLNYSPIPFGSAEAKPIIFGSESRKYNNIRFNLMFF
jgi:hypothetical protein